MSRSGARGGDFQLARWGSLGGSFFFFGGGVRWGVLLVIGDFVGNSGGGFVGFVGSVGGESVVA